MRYYYSCSCSRRDRCAVCTRILLVLTVTRVICGHDVLYSPGQVFATAAQVTQQWGGVGRVHNALLLWLSNQQYDESDGQGDGSHPAKP